LGIKKVLTEIKGNFKWAYRKISEGTYRLIDNKPSSLDGTYIELVQVLESDIPNPATDPSQEIVKIVTRCYPVKPNHVDGSMIAFISDPKTAKRIRSNAYALNRVYGTELKVRTSDMSEETTTKPETDWSLFSNMLDG
jgi:hypothetical protein